MAPWLAGVIGAAGLVALTGCVPGELRLAGEDDGSAGDAARDAGAAGHDATVDVSPSHDAAPNDATPGFEASPTEDTGPADAGPPPPLYCGDASACAVPANFCCAKAIPVARYMCEVATPNKIAGCSELQGTPISCEQGADCPGHLCCGTKIDGGGAYESVECRVACDQDAGGSSIIFCSPEVTPDECAPFGRKCKPSTLLPGLHVCDAPF